MRPIRRPAPPALPAIGLSSVLVAFGSLAGCANPDVAIEVLPPRTSVTCAAPGVSASAFGRGLFDLTTSEGAHGAYFGDLRATIAGGDARITGLHIDYELPSGATDDGTLAALNGVDIDAGDLVLNGQDDDVRVGVLENVELVPRSLAVMLRDSMSLSKTDFGLLRMTITPRVQEGAVVTPVSTTFALDLCEGCLVQPPDICADTAALNTAVCRPGQDVPLFVCTAASASRSQP